MMGVKTLKYTFLVCSVLLLGFMLYQGRDAAVTCDEVLHYQQSVSVYNYFSSHGRDQDALNTPVTHLKYYGQSYDNLVTILIKWFNISDIYGFRHFMSIVAGWLAILITALFAIWISGYRTGLIVLVLFALSPTFLGHSQNNLKDIPFALAYIAGIFYTLKFLLSENRASDKNAILLTLSIAFCLSIRAGGLLLICYLFLFLFLLYLSKYLQEKKVEILEIRDKFIWSCGVALAGYFLGTVLWPYALQNPLLNPLRSYHIMIRFPDTFRQIFEGRLEWSDFMPWYYLPEYMAITIPLIVLAGLLIFICSSGKIFIHGKSFIYWVIVFSVIFPVLFVIWRKSNLYSAWRHFLFIYPGIILISAAGYNQLFTSIRDRYRLAGIILLFILLAVHPLRFMLSNPKYSYIYYNQLIGGLRGAYGNFETDYYYVSLKDGSEWLLKYLKEKKTSDTVRVASNFSVKWYFRDHPEIKTSYLRYEERSQFDWDYLIIANRYIVPYQLKNKIWPPADALKVIYADSVPVCVVLQRKTKDDLLGYEALKTGKIKDAIKFYEQARKIYERDEMIYYYFATALFKDGQVEKADLILKTSLELNPDFDEALMYLGNIAALYGNDKEAAIYYENLISKNRKYFEAYVALSKLLADKDKMKARKLLRDCLTINPGFLPAIEALADSYRQSDPDIAKKYDELANTIKKNN